MKNTLKFSLLTCAIFIFSCKSSEPFSEKVLEEYKKQGYSIGVLEPQKNGKCNYVITVKGSNEQLDPINIEDQKIEKDLSKKTTIVFKYLRLRMQNRCGNLSPIQITEIVEK